MTSLSKAISYTDPLKLLVKNEPESDRMILKALGSDSPEISKEIISFNKVDEIKQSIFQSEDMVAEALQSEAAFTIASDKKPIVAAYGCGPCVALGGYERTNKIAFVVHFSNDREVRNSGELLFNNLSTLVKEPIRSPIELHLRGGIEGLSEATIQAIKIWMNLRNDLPMKIISADILESQGFGDKRGLVTKSLSINSRTGEVSDYNPFSNPKHRDVKMSHFGVMVARGSYKPLIELAYFPR